MALFQPTNITPSVLGELGNGTVDITQDLTVTWQVNGNSAMTAFEIVFYQNNTGSSQLYTTGKVTEGCPFYGTNYAGKVIPFSYTIPTASLTGAGMANGNTYKLIITQYWSDQDSVTQVSAAAFVTRAAPTLVIDNMPETLAAKNATFTATYTQAQGDALNWVRWQIADADHLDNPFYDTGNIYGTAQLQAQYDGFFRESNYAVQCLVQTENGVDVSTGWQPFSVDYAASSLEGAVQVRQERGDRSALLVSWSDVSYIPGSATGDYTIQDVILDLSDDSSVVWDEVNGGPLSFDAPWSVFFKTQLSGGESVLFLLDTSEGTVALHYARREQALSLTLGSETIPLQENLSQYATVTMVLTPTTVYLRLDWLTGGLHPSQTLYPGATLYPRADTIPATVRNTTAVAYTQGTITGITLNGPQKCDWIALYKGAAADADVAAAMAGTFIPVNENGWYFVSNFDNGTLNGGNLGQTDDPLTGLSLYRQQGEQERLEHLIDLPLRVGQVFDYGAASQQGPYVYYLFPTGPETYIADPIVSNPANPCFWNWTVLSCAARTDGGWVVEQEFSFGKNLVSGSITNGNSPQVLKNFTQYPTVQIDPANYQEGTLGSLIGVIDKKTGKYRDSIALRDAIYGLSTTTNTLFLKNRKGDLMEIRTSGPMGMETWDGSAAQAQTVSLPWVQVGSGKGESILLTPEDTGWTTVGSLCCVGEAGSSVLQEKEVTPTKGTQVVKPDIGFTGLTQVTVNAIPSSFGELSQGEDGALTVL